MMAEVAALACKRSMGVILIGPKGRAPMIATDNHMIEKAFCKDSWSSPWMPNIKDPLLNVKL
jgi:hypothetical protein